VEGGIVAYWSNRSENMVAVAEKLKRGHDDDRTGSPGYPGIRTVKRVSSCRFGHA